MSSGKVHSSVSVGLSVGLILAGLISKLLPITESLLIGFGALAGVLITPDLDHDNTVMSHYYVKKYLGRGVRLWWYYLWRSYSIALRHRTRWSHTPFISTTLRLTYLAFPPIILPFSDQQTTSFLRLATFSLLSLIMSLPLWGMIFFYYWADIDITYLLYVFIGLCLSDLLHWIFDII